jgi:hypothetical protein
MPAFEVVVVFRNFEAFETQAAHVVFDGDFRLNGILHAGPVDPGRWIEVINEGRHPAKTLGSDKFFLVQSAVRLAEHDVPLGGDAS